MLHEFLSAQRADLIERCRVKVLSRSEDEEPELGHGNGVAHFLDQLIETLQALPERSAELSGATGSASKSATSEMGVSAARHGRDLAQRGYSVDQVIHDYGDLCQAITESALQVGARIEVDEFRTLNRCLDNAIADSVTEWRYQNNLTHADKATERVDRFIYQLRALIHTATLAVIAIKSGNVGISGATGAVLDRSLIDLRNLLDNSIGDLRGFRPETPAQHSLISVAEFVAEGKVGGLLEAQERGCTLTVRGVDPTLAVAAEEALLSSAVGQLLENACKFSRPNGAIILSAGACGDRIEINVQDSCGGLAAGQAEKMLQLPVPGGTQNAAGGLSLCQHNVQANNGSLSVRDVPGSGCIFTISLPRRSFPKPV